MLVSRCSVFSCVLRSLLLSVLFWPNNQSNGSPSPPAQVCESGSLHHAPVNRGQKLVAIEKRVSEHSASAPGSLQCPLPLVHSSGSFFLQGLGRRGQRLPVSLSHARITAPPFSVKHGPCSTQSCGALSLHLLVQSCIHCNSLGGLMGRGSRGELAGRSLHLQCWTFQTKELHMCSETQPSAFLALCPMRMGPSEISWVFPDPRHSNSEESAVAATRGRGRRADGRQGARSAKQEAYTDARCAYLRMSGLQRHLKLTPAETSALCPRQSHLWCLRPSRQAAIVTVEKTFLEHPSLPVFHAAEPRHSLSQVREDQSVITQDQTVKKARKVRHCNCEAQEH